MQAEQLSNMAYESLSRGYGSQWELMQDVFALLDYRLYLYYKYHQWVGPNNDMKNMLGLVVSREEFEHNLARAAQTGLCDKLEPAELQQLLDTRRALELRLARTAAPLPLLQLLQRFDLDELETNCVLLCYACRLDQKYRRMLAYLQDDVTKTNPATALAASLFLPQGRSMEAGLEVFAGESRFLSLFEPAALAQETLVLDETVERFLSGTLAQTAGLELFDGAATDPGRDFGVGSAVARRLDALLDRPEPSAALLTGPVGSGKRFQLRQAMRRRRDRCVIADLEALGTDPAAMRRGALTARLLDAYLCLGPVDRLEDDGSLAEPTAQLTSALEVLDFPRNKLLLYSRHSIHLQLPIPILELELPTIGSQDRLTLLEGYLEGAALDPDVSLPELAAKFHFQPGQLARACQRARGLAQLEGTALNAEMMHSCCYHQVVHKLDALATRIRPAHSWDDIVLPEAQKKLMSHACDHVRYQHQVYYGWGFDQKISYGKGLSILFAGAPGTGKTMCAQAMAKQLNMEMYKINISQIVSKYIGETEKNLHAVFAEAKNSNCILFFDECDALFGKRSEVKDAHDRNANVEVAYLLQQIEEYDGVCVLATNLVQNIDEAFMRRITYVVHFPFPDKENRKEIYLRTLPKTAPVAPDVNWDFLAEKFQLSGGYIKNIVLSAAFAAAAEARPISMGHLLNAAVGELRKNEIVVVREELREYADLLDS